MKLKWQLRNVSGPLWKSFCLSPSAQRVSSGIKVKLSSQRDRLGIKIKPGASSWKIVSLKIEECQNLMLTPVSWLEIIPEGLAHPHTARLMFNILQNCTNCSSTRVNTRTHLYLVPSQPGVSDTSHKLEREEHSARRIPSFLTALHSIAPVTASPKTQNCFLIPNLEQILGQPGNLVVRQMWECEIWPADTDLKGKSTDANTGLFVDDLSSRYKRRMQLKLCWKLFGKYELFAVL